jgi:hypothetical protein
VTRTEITIDHGRALTEAIRYEPAHVRRYGSKKEIGGRDSTSTSTLAVVPTVIGAAGPRDEVQA